MALNGIEPGLAEYRLPYREDVGQQDGFFHGGVIGGIAEGVMGAAAATLVAVDANVVGAEYEVDLLSPGRGVRCSPAVRGLARPETDRLRADIVALDEDGAERCVPSPRAPWRSSSRMPPPADETAQNRRLGPLPDPREAEIRGGSHDAKAGLDEQTLAARIVGFMPIHVEPLLGTLAIPIVSRSAVRAGSRGGGQIFPLPHAPRRRH